MMMETRFTPKAVRDLEAQFARNTRVWEIMDIIVAEWEADIQSVQCFDLRIVEEAKQLVRNNKKGNRFG